eukprot:scaffold13659_cov193-Alexandrium_tamarense.AAC.2
MYEKGSSAGEGVAWNADRKTAHRLVDGEKKMEMLPEEAESFAKEKFNLPVPEVSEVLPQSPPAVTSTKQVGLFQRLFKGAPRFDSDGKPMHRDNGDWGSYKGELDGDGKRTGTGTMTYDSNNIYEGGFVSDAYSGDGKYKWFDGDEYEGQWKDGERHGLGIFRLADGGAEYSMYEKGVATGEGVAWNPDRSSAHRLIDGEKKMEISLGVAEKFAKDKFDLPVPEIFKPSPVAPQPVVVHQHASQPGLFQRLFGKVDAEGKPMYKDNGDWGSYKGGLDAAGKRTGHGIMTYESGGCYEGGFVNDKYEDDRQATYQWADGDSYKGQWKNGERNGKGAFQTSLGAVEYSMYENGVATGEGVAWSPDRKTAHRLVDGEKKMEMLPEEAESFAKEKFDLPVPGIYEVISPTTPVASTPSAAATKHPGLLQRLFKKFDADGNKMYKDNGDWGSYKGGFDARGKRTGHGVMTYESNSVYDGEFVDDVYSGEGNYRWSDGDSYQGQWKDGERHGKGIFRSATGAVEYSMYENGTATGEGVAWNADRKTAHRLVDGEKKMEMLPEEAESFAKDKFDLPVPEIGATSSPTLAPSSLSNNAGYVGWFKSSVPNTPSPVVPPVPVVVQPQTNQDVENWLLSVLPSLHAEDVKKYSKQLEDDGFDSTEMLDHLMVEDVSGFMKKAHVRVLMQKLKAKQSTVDVEGAADESKTETSADDVEDECK